MKKQKTVLIYTIYQAAMLQEPYLKSKTNLIYIKKKKEGRKKYMVWSWVSES